MPQFPSRFPAAAGFLVPSFFLWLGCSKAAPNEQDVSAAGSGGSVASAGSSASSAGGTGTEVGAAGSPTPLGDGGQAMAGTPASAGAGATTDPAWFSGCDVGEIRGSCEAVDDSGDFCSEFPATGPSAMVDLPGTCGAEHVRSEVRCPTENAVAVCVSLYSRNVFYDREAADAISKVGVCKHYCSDSGGVAAPKCEEFLTCLCGNAEPQEDDSAACVEARDHVATIRRDFGPSNANSQCTKLLDMMLSCAAE